MNMLIIHHKSWPNSIEWLWMATVAIWLWSPRQKQVGCVVCFSPIGDNWRTRLRQQLPQGSEKVKPYGLQYIPQLFLRYHMVPHNWSCLPDKTLPLCFEVPIAGKLLHHRLVHGHGLGRFKSKVSKSFCTGLINFNYAFLLNPKMHPRKICLKQDFMTMYFMIFMICHDISCWFLWTVYVPGLATRCLDGSGHKIPGGNPRSGHAGDPRNEEKGVMLSLQCWPKAQLSPQKWVVNSRYRGYDVDVL